MTGRHQGHIALHRAQHWLTALQRRRHLGPQSQDGATRYHQHRAELTALPYYSGRAHRGIVYMFHMMNEARLGVGMWCRRARLHGISQVGRVRPRTFAGPAAGRQGSVDFPQESDHRARRRQANVAGEKAYVEGGLALLLYCAKLADEGDKRGARHPHTDRQEPPSQWCLRPTAWRSIHGGYGYTREYDVEQHYRDNRLNPIHEGTHGIQSLDLLGRKVTVNGGASLVALGSGSPPR